MSFQKKWANFNWLYVGSMEFLLTIRSFNDICQEKFSLLLKC